MGPLKRLIGSLFFLYRGGRKGARRRKALEAPQSFRKHPQCLPKASPKRSQSVAKASQSIPKASQSLPKHPRSLPKPPQSLPRLPQTIKEAPQTLSEPTHLKLLYSPPLSCYFLGRFAIGFWGPYTNRDKSYFLIPIAQTR